MTSTQGPRLLRPAEVSERFGLARSAISERLGLGLLPPPIRLNSRVRRFVASEIDSVLDAQIAGADDAAVHALIGRLITARAIGAPT